MQTLTSRAAALVAVVALVGAFTSCGRFSDRQDASPGTTVAAPPAGTGSPGAGDTRTGSTTGTAATPIPTPTVTIVPATAATATMQDGIIRTPDGRDRAYHLYVPTSLPPDRPVPLLLALHGGIGWGLQYAKNSGFDALAEANQFIVVFPDGVGPALKEDTLRTWNGGACCGGAVKQNVDDVMFLSMLIDTIEAQHPIDKARVFAAGHSNGGIMDYRLACELADKVVAIGLQSSSLELEQCHPSRPVSLLHIHGTADDNVPIDGGRGPNGISGVAFRPPIDGVRTIAAADGCSAEPETTTDPANADLTVLTWGSCRDGTAVEMVKVAGAGHAWMGSGSPPSRLLGAVYPDYHSTEEIWTFLINHPRR